jgi:hypothetical protein
LFFLFTSKEDHEKSKSSRFGCCFIVSIAWRCGAHAWGGMRFIERYGQDRVDGYFVEHLIAKVGDHAGGSWAADRRDDGRDEDGVGDDQGGR